MSQSSTRGEHPSRQLPTPQNHAHGAERWMALAPMDGVTDHVFRTLITGLYQGCCGIDICVTEFVRVTDQPIPDAVFLRHCPELQNDCATPSGIPVMVQLLGGSPPAMARAARQAVALGASGIDINFGCPAKTVNRHDGGASILKAPARISSITKAVRDAVPPDTIVSTKIRLGWDSDAGLEDLAIAAEQGGAAWLTIHARTKAQMYRPPVNWKALARARSVVSMPVVANGDIFDPASDQSCQQQSRCGAIMIGRGIMADPGIFLRLRGHDIAIWTLPQLAKLWIEYGEQMVKAAAARVHPLGRVKQWVRMAAQIRPELAPAFDRIKRIQDWNTARAQLSRWSNGAALVSPAAPGLSADPKNDILAARERP